MNIKTIAASVMIAGVLSPAFVMAQESHADAKAQVEARDKVHHNKAKIVGGSAAGGAATGALVGGPVGAVVGGGVGAVGGVVANKARKHHSIKKREHEEQ
jgi:outer membrane lipoprotein SlyB